MGFFGSYWGGFFGAFWGDDDAAAGSAGSSHAARVHPADIMNASGHAAKTHPTDVVNPSRHARKT